MNETGHTKQHSSRRSRTERASARWGAVAAGLVALALGALIGGCADPRTEPAPTRSPGYTETIVLFEGVVSAGQQISVAFSVDQDLAPIVHPGQDTPARLRIAGFIRSDDPQIVRRELIVGDLLPELSDSIVGFLVTAADLELQLDVIDSCLAHPETCDTTGKAAARAEALDSLQVVDSLRQVAIDDTTTLGIERDSLALVLDDRYALAIWLDEDTTTYYPEGEYVDATTVGGQGIYLASTGDSTATYPGMKGRGFDLPLDRFQAADLNSPGETREVNWTTCFPGSTRPCLSTGSHTFLARLTGTESRITATLVLVYAEETP